MISAALAIMNDEGQRQEISDIYEKNRTRFYNIAYSRVHNKQDAEDAVQEAFLRIADKQELKFLNFIFLQKCPQSAL